MTLIDMINDVIDKLEDIIELAVERHGIPNDLIDSLRLAQTVLQQIKSICCRLEQ